MIALLVITILCLFYMTLAVTDHHRSIYLFVPFNFAFDLIYSVISTDQLFGAIAVALRFAAILSFYLGIFYRYYGFINVKVLIIISLLFVLGLFSIFQSSNISTSGSELVKFTLILISVLVYSTYFSCNYLSSSRFTKSILFIYTITIVNTLLSSYYNFGWNGYGGSLNYFTGGIVSNMWYVPSIAVILGLYVQQANKNKLFYLFQVLTLIIVLLSFRRSAYALLVIGYLISLRFQINYSSKLKLIFTPMLVLSVFMILGSDILSRQLEARQKTFDRGVEGESRFLETQDLWTERFDGSNYTSLFFGGKAFDSIGNYGNGRFSNRMLHVDMNIVFFSFGLVGLILYSCLYLVMFLEFQNKYRFFNKKPTKFILGKLFYFALFVVVVLFFSGGLNAITYRVYILSVLGAVMGQTSLLNRRPRNSEHNELLI